jgi:hypothetical protein
MEDGKAEAILEAVQESPFLDQKPSALKHGIWWDLQFEGISSPEIQQNVDKIAITRSRTEGLFANPHYQTVHTFYP